MGCKDHILYKPKDFTAQEIKLKNVIALAVVKAKLNVCKVCSKMEEELLGPCETSRGKLLRLTEEKLYGIRSK